MSTLVELFESLPVPKEKYLYSATPIPTLNNHKVGKDSLGAPALLLHVVGQINLSGNVKLQNLSIVQGLSCRVNINSRKHETIYTVISFIGCDAELHKYFLNLSELFLQSLGNKPTQQQVMEIIKKFAELFKALSAPPIKSIQGLWAELFLICQSTNPDALILAWHNFPEEKFDFNNSLQRVEVKSASGRIRTHYFSSEQLNPPGNSTAIIASLFIEKAGSGSSINSLLMEVCARVNNSSLIEKVHLIIGLTLGNSIHYAGSVFFDREVAEESLNFYSTDHIPKIALGHIPLEVYEVKYKADLTDILPITEQILKKHTGLYNVL